MNTACHLTDKSAPNADTVSLTATAQRSGKQLRFFRKQAASSGWPLTRNCYFATMMHRLVLNYLREPTRAFSFVGNCYERELALRDAEFYQMPDAYREQLRFVDFGM